ncbi:Zinc-finger associated domain (zf-AD) [Polyrhizophydium stewartii]|uniref:Zinc-finger associated domain (Zf-AD) n=1 Tax=Polyrhizophydium stewartii TaxID=2732419 RepID=A0ABR4NKN2_9FUNG
MARIDRTHPPSHELIQHAPRDQALPAQVLDYIPPLSAHAPREIAQATVSSEIQTPLQCEPIPTPLAPSTTSAQAHRSAIEISSISGLSPDFCEPALDPAHRFECSFCGKTFRRKQGLVAHLPSHTGQYPFGCKYCKQRFSRKHDAERSTHEMERKYVCHFCGRAFHRKDARDRHLKSASNRECPPVLRETLRQMGVRGWAPSETAMSHGSAVAAAPRPPAHTGEALPWQAGDLAEYLRPHMQ